MTRAHQGSSSFSTRSGIVAMIHSVFLCYEHSPNCPLFVYFDGQPSPEHRYSGLMTLLVYALKKCTRRKVRVSLTLQQHLTSMPLSIYTVLLSSLLLVLFVATHHRIHHG